MKRLLYFLPALAFLVIAGFFARSLIWPAPQALPSMLIDKPAPNLVLPALDKDTHGFGPEDLRQGHVTVITFWGGWCKECLVEVQALAALSKMPGVSLYGIDYKDRTAEDGRAFLNANGNPFARIGRDLDGRVGIEWGVYGAPETFIVDGKGIVRERFVGPITLDTLQSDVLPAIERAAS